MIKRNKFIVLLLLLGILTSCNQSKKIEVAYYEIGGMEQVTLNYYKTLFNKDENIVSYIILKDKDNCSSCYGGTNAEIAQYAVDNHFKIYELVFDYESETFVEDYNSLADLMAVNNGDYGIKKITEYKDGVPVIYSLPSLLITNSGYIGLNVNKNFITTLKENIIAKK